MPNIQLALDTSSLGEALAVAEKAADLVDSLEAGTVLCLTAGLQVIRDIKHLDPEKPIVADIRIGRAGRLFSSLALSHGADVVTMLAEAPNSVILEAIESAHAAGGRIELELPFGASEELIRSSVATGADGIIVHQRSGSDFRVDSWLQTTLSMLTDMKGRFAISLAGGLNAESIAQLNPAWAIDTLVVGSEVTKSIDPRAMLREIRSALPPQRLGQTQ